MILGILGRKLLHGAVPTTSLVRNYGIWTSIKSIIGSERTVRLPTNFSSLLISQIIFFRNSK